MLNVICQDVSVDRKILNSLPFYEVTGLNDSIPVRFLGGPVLISFCAVHTYLRIFIFICNLSSLSFKKVWPLSMVTLQALLTVFIYYLFE